LGACRVGGEEWRGEIDRTGGGVVPDEVCGRLRRLPRGDGPVRRARIENRSLGCVVDDVDPLVVGVVLVCSSLCVRRTAEERVAGLTRVREVTAVAGQAAGCSRAFVEERIVELRPRNGYRLRRADVLGRVPRVTDEHLLWAEGRATVR